MDKCLFSFLFYLFIAYYSLQDFLSNCFASETPTDFFFWHAFIVDVLCVPNYYPTPVPRKP